MPGRALKEKPWHTSQLKLTNTQVSQDQISALDTTERGVAPLCSRGFRPAVGSVDGFEIPELSLHHHQQEKWKTIVCIQKEKNTSPTND